MLKILNRLIKWSGEKRKRLYIGFIWSFFNSIFISMPIVGAAYLLNLILESQRGNIVLSSKLPLYAFLFMIAMILGRFLFSYLRAVYQESIAYEVSVKERVKIGDILKRVSLGFFDKNNMGELTSAITTDMSFIEMFAMKMVDTVVNGYIGAFVMIGCLAIYAPPVALIALLGVALSAFFLRCLGKRSKTNAPVHQMAQDEMTATTLEYVRGISIIKAYGQTGVAVEAIRKAYNDSKNINIKIEIEYVPFNCLHLLSLKIASVIVVLVASIFALSGSMDIPIFLMISIFSFMIFSHVELINNAVHVFEIIDATMDKLDKIKNSKYIDENGKDKKLKTYDIVMKNVTFAYDNRNVLNDISFTVPQGSTTAIVGPSGSGKSTVCSLISRFYDVDKGAVKIGGVDVKELTCDSLLKNISMVFQNVYLFHDTVLNNIRFGNPSATKEEVIDAAKKACCHDFIMALPDGYDTIVGEGGSSLSGGEKQRVSIARAILKDAPIIILDEATASIDPENEFLIQNAISALTQDKTMIVIAHRLATIENADQILVLEEGNLVQCGTNEELLAQEGIYKRFISIRRESENWRL